MASRADRGVRADGATISISFAFDDDTPPIWVAPNLGWSNFTDWACSLPDEDYPDLIHLCRFGWASGPEVIRGQVAHALDAFPPQVEGVEEIGREIVREALMGLDADATVMVVDSMSDLSEDEDNLDDEGDPPVEKVEGA